MTWGPVSFDPHPGGFLNVASGVLLVALGVFAASVKPRRRANIAFAGFSACWGLSTIVGWTLGPERGVLLAAPESPLYLASRIAVLLLFGAAIACLLLVAVWFPQPISARERPFVWTAALGAGLFGLFMTGLWAAAVASKSGIFVEQGFAPLARYVLAALSLVNVVARSAAFLFVLFLLALRAGLAHREGRDAEHRLYVLVTVALVLYAGALNGIWTSAMNIHEYPGSTLIPVFAGLCTLAALWLTHTRSGPAHAIRTSRNVALLVLALPVVAWTLFTLLKTYVMPGQPPGLAGAMRTLTVLVLAYAILRHQLLGADVKLRWTISKSSVAAVFVAAFFIASEGAQILFGQGNEWVGLFTAGALVFALAPLQRAAERLAEKAVPVTVTPTGGGLTNAEAAYVAALRAAARDGVLSRREEHHLADVAEHLGIGPKRALELRELIEAERVEPEVSP